MWCGVGESRIGEEKIANNTTVNSLGGQNRYNATGPTARQTRYGRIYFDTGHTNLLKQ